MELAKDFQQLRNLGLDLPPATGRGDLDEIEPTAAVETSPDFDAVDAIEDRLDFSQFPDQARFCGKHRQGRRAFSGIEVARIAALAYGCREIAEGFGARKWGEWIDGCQLSQEELAQSAVGDVHEVETGGEVEPITSCQVADTVEARLEELHGIFPFMDCRVPFALVNTIAIFCDAGEGCRRIALATAEEGKNGYGDAVAGIGPRLSAVHGHRLSPPMQRSRNGRRVPDENAKRNGGIVPDEPSRLYEKPQQLPQKDRNRFRGGAANR